MSKSCLLLFSLTCLLWSARDNFFYISVLLLYKFFMTTFPHPLSTATSSSVSNNCLFLTTAVSKTMVFFNPASTLFLTVLTSVVFCADSACVEKEDFCLVQYANNVTEVCNKFRDEVVVAKCARKTNQRLSFSEIGAILAESRFASQFFKFCNCECRQASGSSYVREDKACFDRAFRFGTGICPQDSEVLCSDIKFALCPELNPGVTGGNMIGC